MRTRANTRVAPNVAGAGVRLARTSPHPGAGHTPLHPTIGATEHRHAGLPGPPSGPADVLHPWPPVLGAPLRVPP
ncbi:hypothetical protein GCM10009872_00520 [Actinopolymorpha rutila]